MKQTLLFHYPTRQHPPVVRDKGAARQKTIL